MNASAVPFVVLFEFHRKRHSTLPSTCNRKSETKSNDVLLNTLTPTNVKWICRNNAIYNIINISKLS